MEILRIAAFADGNEGGNPAGVVIGDTLPAPEVMQRVAAEVGFSETAFAAPLDAGANGWRVRYFAPESEVPFCGHATIALGAALAAKQGDGIFALTLNHAAITVEGWRQGSLYGAALQSPPTSSKPADPALLAAALRLFDLQTDDLDPRIPPAVAYGGVYHLVLALQSRERLAVLRYGLEAGKLLMRGADLTTISLIQAETEQLFHSRNPFASGGVYEDPATGAAAAALAGYLRDIGWPHRGAIDILQGEDMEMRSKLRAEIPSEKGSSIRVSGLARWLA